MSGPRAGPRARSRPSCARPAAGPGGGDGPSWERESRPSGDRWYRVLIDDTTGSRQVTQFVGAIPPGRAPDHFHEYEEVLCILAGSGSAVGGRRVRARRRRTLRRSFRRGQVHCTENTGPGELRLLGVFYPAGSPAVSYAAD